MTATSNHSLCIIVESVGVWGTLLGDMFNVLLIHEHVSVFLFMINFHKLCRADHSNYFYINRLSFMKIVHKLSVLNMLNSWGELGNFRRAVNMAIGAGE